MKLNRMIAAILLGVALALSTSTSSAQQLSSSQDLVEGIIEDVINRTVEAAREEVRRNTGIDPLQRGYDPSRSYEPAPSNASEETRRELQKLNEEHDRKIVKLEDELHQKLDKAQAEFEREAAKEDKREKIEEKREKLEQNVDEAYANFEEKIGEENERFDEKRSKILGKERGFWSSQLEMLGRFVSP